MKDLSRDLSSGWVLFVYPYCSERQINSPQLKLCPLMIFIKSFFYTKNRPHNYTTLWWCTLCFCCVVNIVWHLRLTRCGFLFTQPKWGCGFVMVWLLANQQCTLHVGTSVSLAGKGSFLMMCVHVWERKSFYSRATSETYNATLCIQDKKKIQMYWMIALQMLTDH